jgi:hypothetical protein
MKTFRPICVGSGRRTGEWPGSRFPCEVCGRRVLTRADGSAERHRETVHYVKKKERGR